MSVGRAHAAAPVASHSLRNQSTILVKLYQIFFFIDIFTLSDETGTAHLKQNYPERKIKANVFI